MKNKYQLTKLRFTPSPMDRVRERTKKQVIKIKEICPHAKVIFDIGANVGYFSCYFAYFYPNANIISFEPVKENYDVLVENIKLNGLQKQVSAYNCAILDIAGEVEIGLPKATDNIGLYSIHHHKTSVRKVPAYVLADFIDLKPDIVKIDVEGTENRVLKGNKEILEHAKVIQIENNPSFEKPLITHLNGFIYHSNNSKNDELWIKQTNPLYLLEN